MLVDDVDAVADAGGQFVCGESIVRPARLDATGKLNGTPDTDRRVHAGIVARSSVAAVNQWRRIPGCRLDGLHVRGRGLRR